MPRSAATVSSESVVLTDEVPRRLRIVLIWASDAPGGIETDGAFAWSECFGVLAQPAITSNIADNAKAPSKLKLLIFRPSVG